MKLTLAGAAIATFGLSLAVQAAPAGPVRQGGAPLTGHTGNGVILVHNPGAGGGGPHGGGGYYGGGGLGSWKSGGPGNWKSSGNWKGSGNWKSSGNWKGNRNWKGTGNWKGAPAGAHWGWRHGRRGYWYGGNWYWWGGGFGGSCFAECLTSGYSPAYCTANSWEFCY